MWEKIKIISGSIWTFVLPFCQQMLKESGPILMAAAMTAVQAAAGGRSSLVKRQEAFDAVKADLAQRGIQVGTSVINAAIELAVVRYKTP